MRLRKGKEIMRNVLAVVAIAVIVLVLMIGLRWFELVSQDAAVVGFVTGIVIAVVMALTNRRRGSTG
jgi:membrane associated rhomboid family serine protease